MIDNLKRFIIRKEIIAEVGIGAYNRAVESKKIHIYKTGDSYNCKQRVDRNEYERYLKSMIQGT